MDVKQVPYFAFEVNAWDSNRDRISLHSDNIEILLNRLEKGENIFEVISELRRENFCGFGLKYGLFERRSEIDIDGGRYVSDEGYRQVGKLLVPYHEIATRKKIISFAENSSANYADRVKCVKVLDAFPEADMFYSNRIGSYVPLNKDEVLVLEMSQL